MKFVKCNLLMALCMLTATVGFAQVTDFNDWDANRDGMTDRQEFNDSFADSYSAWDMNNDGNIDDREFYETTYTRLDEDGDGNLDQAEWESGYENVYGDYADVDAYDNFDADGDRRVTADEYYDGMAETDFYTSYDTNQDGSIDEDELSTGVFDRMDENRDGSIDQNEYDLRSAYYIGDIDY